MNNIKKPELLSPAGDLERLKMAITYGADAVYLAGREFGMRAAAANFSDDDMAEGIEFTHERGKRVYVTCNTLPREDELPRLKEYLGFLNEIKADALIIADLGVLQYAKKYAPDVKKHVSTQLGVVNSETANFLLSQGADTAVLAREVPLEDIYKIRKNIPSEMRLETFVHGAMCVSFSGRCLLSNYLTGRDANRGQCAQPCRWKYHLVEETRPGEYFEISEDNGTFILNSNDMCMIEHLGELMDAGVDSFKIEGRMKSSYYTAVITNAYRHAIDNAAAGLPPGDIWINETNMVSHRPYCTGFFYGYPGQHYGTSSYTQDAQIVAVCEECDSEGNATLTQRNKFYQGDTLELLVPGGEPVSFVAEHIYNSEGTELEDTPRAMMELKMKLPACAPKYSIIRKSKGEKINA